MAPFDLKTVLTIIHREVLDSLRDWRIVTPTLVLTTLFPFIMNFTSGVMFSFLSEYNATLIGERLIPFGMMVVGFFPITFSLVIALESFVGESCTSPSCSRRWSSRFQPLLSASGYICSLFRGANTLPFRPCWSSRYCC
jgi:hypothetical protein